MSEQVKQDVEQKEVEKEAEETAEKDVVEEKETPTTDEPKVKAKNVSKKEKYIILSDEAFKINLLKNALNTFSFPYVGVSIFKLKFLFKYSLSYGPFKVAIIVFNAV